MHKWALGRVDPVMILLLTGVALLYLSARALVDALVGRGTGHGSLRALGYWIPIAMLTVWCLLIGQSGAALQLIFTTSVASLSLVLGTSLLTAPAPPTQRTERRLGAFVLPVALLVLLSGFHARLTWWHGAIFLLQGLALLLLFSGRDSAQADPALKPPRTPPSPLRLVQGLLALILAGIGGWLALRGLVTPGHAPRVGAALRAGLILGPGLCIVMIGAGAQLSQRNRGDTVLTTQVTLVLLNLCLLLPLVIFLGYLLPAPDAPLATSPPATLPSTFPVVDAPSPPVPVPDGLAFPLLTWRVDAVLLVVMGLLLMPVSLGRFTPGRAEGIFALALFVAYLLATTFFHAMR